MWLIAEKQEKTGDCREKEGKSERCKTWISRLTKNPIVCVENTHAHTIYAISVSRSSYYNEKNANWNTQKEWWWQCKNLLTNKRCLVHTNFNYTICNTHQIIFFMGEKICWFFPLLLLFSFARIFPPEYQISYFSIFPKCIVRKWIEVFFLYFNSLLIFMLRPIFFYF